MVKVSISLFECLQFGLIQAPFLQTFVSCLSSAILFVCRGDFVPVFVCALVLLSVFSLADRFDSTFYLHGFTCITSSVNFNLDDRLCCLLPPLPLMIIIFNLYPLFSRALFSSCCSDVPRITKVVVMDVKLPKPTSLSFKTRHRFVTLNP